MRIQYSCNTFDLHWPHSAASDRPPSRSDAIGHRPGPARASVRTRRGDTGLRKGGVALVEGVVTRLWRGVVTMLWRGS